MTIAAAAVMSVAAAVATGKTTIVAVAVMSVAAAVATGKATRVAVAVARNHTTPAVGAEPNSLARPYLFAQVPDAV